jgi:beta-lactam-binding protein with PASTA domain
MSRLFRILLRALVLAIVFLASALTAMRMAVHGREVAVPKLIGLSPAEAERVAAADGLLLQRESRFYSPDVPEGHILQQLPAPGTTVRRGWRVRVAESLGPQRVSIPNVVGQSQRAAEINLARRGLEAGSIAVAHVPGVPAGQIAAQDPPAGSEGVLSPRINLLLSAPAEPGAAPANGEFTSAQTAWENPDAQEAPRSFVMPNFIGRTLGAARVAITDAGFKLGAVTARPVALSAPGLQPPAADDAFRSRNRAGFTEVITRQSPAPGQKIALGAVITLEVAREQ